MLLARERHLPGQFVAREPAQLGNVVRRDRLPFAPHDPRDGENVPPRVRLDVDTHQLDGLDVEPRLLAELAAQSRDRVLGLTEKAPGDVPMAEPRLEPAAGEQHLPVTLEDSLHPGDRVGPVALVAGRTCEMIPREVEFSAAAGTEVPVVEHTHGEDMMENPEPTEQEQELANTDRQQEEEDMRGVTNPDDEDNLPTEDDAGS